MDSPTPAGTRNYGSQMSSLRASRRDSLKKNRSSGFQPKNCKRGRPKAFRIQLKIAFKSNSPRAKAKVSFTEVWNCAKTVLEKKTRKPSVEWRVLCRLLWNRSRITHSLLREILRGRHNYRLESRAKNVSLKKKKWPIKWLRSRVRKAAHQWSCLSSAQWQCFYLIQLAQHLLY